MITQNEVVAKLDELKTQSITDNPSRSALIETTMQPVYDLVQSYFSTQSPELKQALEDLVFYLFCDIQRRTTVREHNFDCGYPTDFPEAYWDIRKCFYTFPLMEVSNGDFSDAWKFTSDPVTMAVTAENPYLTTWESELKTAPADDVTRIKSVTDWCQGACGNSNLIHLFEDEGIIIQSLNTQKIARRIYNTRYLQEVIRDRNLNVYIPTYLRGDF